MSGPQQPHGYPPSDSRTRRPGADNRNGAAPGAGDSGMSRAQAFEDEKRRIIATCFSKQDTDGAALENYITHIRITEDAAHPSTPPPPNSPPDNKKPRVIIVAVRKSGRVRMHKARENSDGSFSIGKTWLLDDLTAIQSYNNFTPTSTTDQQHKQWASDLGFLVTVSKPYYWQASTAKEKDFFLGSLVKIYRKYTGGKLPKLIGFDEREQQLLGVPPSAISSTASPPAAKELAPAPGRSANPAISQPPTSPLPKIPPSPRATRAPSRDGKRDFPLKSPAPDSPAKLPQLPPPRRDPIRSPAPGQPPARPLPTAPVPTGMASKSSDSLSASVSRPGTERKEEAPNLIYGRASPEAIRSRNRSQDDKSIDSRPSTGRPPPSRDGLSSIDTKSSSTLNAVQQPSRPTTSGSTTDQTSLSTTRPNGNSERKKFSEDSGRPSRPSSRHSNSPPLDGDKSNRSSKNLDRDLPPALGPASSGGPDHKNVVEYPPEPPTSKESVTAPLKTAVSEPTVESSTAAPAVASPPERPATEPAEDDAEVHRPGLGPMVKKKSAKEIAGAFRKAANAYNAFKPRPGGAGERLMALKNQANEPSDEPDGITSVVPAPLLRGNSGETTKTVTSGVSGPPPTASSAPQAPPIVTVPSSVQEPPRVEITRADTEEYPAPAGAEGLGITTTDKEEASNQPGHGEAETAEQRSRSKSPQDRRRKRREDHTGKYLQALGIDPGVLQGRGADFDDILTDLGWHGRLSDDRKIEDLEADIRREIGRVQATSWLGNVEQQEGKIDQLAKLIDKTIEECDELDGLLTLYSHELGTLHDDVSYIEAQSQGLQVQTANQKLLQSELQNLLQTLSISSRDLQPLHEASLSNVDGIRDTEIILSTLYRAMVTIDSDVRQNKKRMADAAGDHSSVGVYADAEIGQMRAVREKKDEYRLEAASFLQRLRQYMPSAFRSAEQKRLTSANGIKKDSLKLDSTARATARQDLWVYHALMLFAREVSSTEWNGMIGAYEHENKPAYQIEFRDNQNAWQKAAKKPTGDEHELLFTHHEKEKDSETITSAARKLTVRRGKTIRVTGASRIAANEKQTGRLEPYEVFAGSLQETVRVISEEQNFFTQFFHLNSLSNVEFPDIVSNNPPEDRKCPDFKARQPHDPDRDLARKVEVIMDGFYSFWVNDMQNVVDWVLRADQIQGVGVLAALEATISEFEDTNQEFIVHALQKLHGRLNGLFTRFVDEQIRGIEETKVKVNKRKGVISFMRVFPHFSTAIENMLSSPTRVFSETRLNVNDAYNKINRAMWESLKFIAREAPGHQAIATGAGGDPEDKEALNYHILLIENMNHYIEEVDVRDLPVLETWKDRAVQDYHEHLKLYIDAVIRRPLGKLLDFVESTESLLTTVSNPADIALRTSHSKLVVKKLLASYDTKEIRRGGDLLKKRVEKHFGDADDPGLSRSLVVKVLSECDTRYADAYDRMKAIIDTVYEGQINLEWNKEDASAMFRRL